MKPQKQPVAVNFARGLNTKSDPWQVPVGEFEDLQNTIFTKAGLMQKRNGYAQLPTLPNSSSTHLTTLNGNLTAVGSTIAALNAGNDNWVSKGSIDQVSLSTLPLIRNSVNQTQCDTAIASNGNICTVYTQTNAGSSTYMYAIADSVTGQNIISPTAIPAGSGAITGSPRVFLLGNYFVIVYTNTITAVAHLQYVSISVANPTTVTTPQDIAAAYIPSSLLSWDGVVGTNDRLYIAYNQTAGGQSIKVTYLSLSAAILGQTPATAVTFASEICTIMSMCIDTTGSFPVVYAAYYDVAGHTGKVLAVNYDLTTRMSATSVITSNTVSNITCAALSGVLTYYAEVNNNYSSGDESHFIAYRKVTLPATVTTGTVSPAAGSASSGTVCVRGVGLASKAFILNGNEYFLSTFQSISTYQPTFFLINGTTSLQTAPIVVAKFASGNGGGDLTLGLPNVTVSGLMAYMPYLNKDFVAAQNTVSATPVANPVVGVYSQTGINLASLVFGGGVDTAEIAANLHITGGFLWQYDGYLPVEHNFLLYPEIVMTTSASTGGHLTDQQYYYVSVYEWEDNQGNVYRSTPSLPKTITTVGGGASAVTINTTYMRLTRKIANPAKIVIYRWSVAQPIFYRVTSLTSVQLNLTTSDELSFVDTLADASIVGNDILYTTGGVLEDTNAPAFDAVFLFDDRLWGIDAEDKNLLWFSKQVIEATPVEMSDLLTIYVAPSIGAQGPTGPLKCGAAMDDKLILFKASAINYINGTGPDNTGANNQYSQPIFITATVGCSNQQSIVFQPQGLMFEFQSEAGNQIWLLDRNLGTSYIGAAVETFTQNATVESAVNIPGTNQVRFTLSSGITLMYDYYFQQWGTFTNVPATSSCVYQGVQAFINSSGQVYQESSGTYLDGSNPVLMSFITGWLNLAGLQGYQRAFFFYLLGRYLSPHKMFIQVAYDYNSAPQDSVIITPTNFSPVYGGSGSDAENPYGQQLTYGGSTDVESWRVFLKKQRCQSFQISFNEIFDPSMGLPAGAGLTLSGLNIIVGVKSGWRTQSSGHSAGTN